MYDFQDINHALTNAESMNSDPRFMSSSLNDAEGNSFGGNSFTGLGEEKQAGDIDAGMAGIASMQNPGQTEEIGDGQASMEGSQGGRLTRH